MLRINARRGDAESIRRYYEQLNEEVRPGMREDYFASESAGRWMGGAAMALGLGGQAVGTRDFELAASGYMPRGGGQVRNAGAENRRAGYDFTFSAPKSVSVAWALADAEKRAAIDQALREAVEVALDYAERKAGIVRTGHAGAYTQKAKFLASAYTHHTSREQDPQLHVHCFVHNLAISEDGQVRTIESRPCFKFEQAIGAAFRVEVARAMERLGYTVELEGKAFRLAEIDQRLIHEFSKRSQQVAQFQEEAGTVGAGRKAVEAAVLATRRAKEVRHPDELTAEWRERARQALELEPIRRPEPEEAIPRDLEALKAELTAKDSVFTEAQVAAHVMRACQDHSTVAEAEEVVQAVLEHHAVKLSGDWYTTPEQLERERAMLANADKLAARDQHRLTPVQTRDAVAAFPQLSTEQAEAVAQTLQGGDLALIQGAAGAGKTTKREFAAGDRIVFGRNVNKPSKQDAMGGEVRNGYTGSVEAISKGRGRTDARLVVRLDDGTLREFDTKDYGHLDHAYALTVHKSQGSTYDTCRVLADAGDFGAREAGYVAVSRARGETHIYGDREAIIDTAKEWKSEAQKRNALDFTQVEINPEQIGLELEPPEQTRPSLADSLGFTEGPAVPTKTRQPGMDYAQLPEETELSPNSDEALRRARVAEGERILAERAKERRLAEMKIAAEREKDPTKRAALGAAWLKETGRDALEIVREQRGQREAHSYGPALSM